MGVGGRGRGRVGTGGTGRGGNSRSIGWRGRVCPAADIDSNWLEQPSAKDARSSDRVELERKVSH